MAKNKLSSNELNNKPSSKVIKFSPKQIRELADTLSNKEGREFVAISFGLNHFANTQHSTADDGIKIMKGKKIPLGGIEAEYNRAIGNALQMSDYSKAA